MALRRKPDVRPQQKSTKSIGRERSRRSSDVRRDELNRAVRSGMLRVVGEPVVDVVTQKLVGHEAVLRLPGLEPEADPALDLIGEPAGEPEPNTTRSKLLATRAMLAAVDDDHVVALNHLLVEGIRSLAADLGIGQQDDLFVSVTVDARFVADDRFLETVKESVRLAGLQADQLLLSIDATPGFESLWSKLQRLKSHGARVAVHNVTLGSTSTDVLRRYPLDVVRFVLNDLDEEVDGDDSLLGGTVKLANNLGCATIVDDVHTIAELERLRKLACGAAHGFIEPGSAVSP